MSPSTYVDGVIGKITEKLAKSTLIPSQHYQYTSDPFKYLPISNILVMPSRHVRKTDRHKSHGGL